MKNLPGCCMRILHSSFIILHFLNNPTTVTILVHLVLSAYLRIQTHIQKVSFRQVNAERLELL